MPRRHIPTFLQATKKTLGGSIKRLRKFGGGFGLGEAELARIGDAVEEALAAGEAKTSAELREATRDILHARSGPAGSSRG